MAKYENGELTQLAYEKLYDFPMDDEFPGDMYISELNNLKAFYDQIKKRTLTLGFSEDVSDEDKITEYIVKLSEENHVYIDAKSLKRWLGKTDDTPENTEKARENVYKICFALKMSAFETEEFFFKGYLERPFNYKNIREAVYYFCLKNGSAYSDAERIITKIENAKQVDTKDADNVTAVIAQNIKTIENEDDLVKYIVENRSGFTQNNATAIGIIKDLLQPCYELAIKDIERNERASIELEKEAERQRKLESNEEIATTSKKKKDKEKAENAFNIDQILKAIYGYSARATEDGKLVFPRSISDESASNFPKLIRRNFPQREQIQNIMKDSASNDVVRKTLIMLNFYSFFATLMYNNELNNKTLSVQEKDDKLFEGLFNEFVDEMNAILEQCGYVQLYWRNPFDWMIGYCATRLNPLDALKDVIYDLYLSNDEAYMPKTK